MLVNIAENQSQSTTIKCSHNDCNEALTVMNAYHCATCDLIYCLTHFSQHFKGEFDLCMTRKLHAAEAKLP